LEQSGKAIRKGDEAHVAAEVDGTWVDVKLTDSVVTGNDYGAGTGIETFTAEPPKLKRTTCERSAEVNNPSPGESAARTEEVLQRAQAVDQVGTQC
jgi:hypothetical protein